jgi:hypothetical protein
MKLTGEYTPTRKDKLLALLALAIMVGTLILEQAWR